MHLLGTYETHNLKVLLILSHCSSFENPSSFQIFFSSLRSPMTKIFAYIPFLPWQSKVHICVWLILPSTHSEMQASIHFFLWHSVKMFWQVKMAWELWTIYVGHCRLWQKSNHESNITRKVLSTLLLDSILFFLLVCPWNINSNHLISLPSLYLPYSFDFLYFLFFIYCIHPSMPFCIISSNKPSPSQIEYLRKIL